MDNINNKIFKQSLKKAIKKCKELLPKEYISYHLIYTIAGAYYFYDSIPEEQKTYIDKIYFLRFPQHNYSEAFIALEEYISTKRDSFIYYLWYDTYQQGRENDIYYRHCMWFIEKYIIPIDEEIKFRSCLCLRDRDIIPFVYKYNKIQPGKDDTESNHQLEKELPKYANAWIADDTFYLLHRHTKDLKEERKLLFNLINSSKGIAFSIKRSGTFNLDYKFWKKEEKSDVLRLRAYLSMFPAMHKIHIGDVLSQDSIHTVRGNAHTYSLGDIYAKIIYDISLGIEYDFLHNIDFALYSSYIQWNNCHNLVSKTIMRAHVDNPELYRGLDSVLKYNEQTFEPCLSISKYNGTLSVLESFYSMLVRREQIIILNTCINIRNKVLKREKLKVYATDLPEHGLYEPLPIVSGPDFADNNPYYLKYIKEHRRNICKFIFESKDNKCRDTDLKWVDNNSKIVIRMLEILHINMLDEIIFPLTIFICYQVLLSLRNETFDTKTLYQPSEKLHDIRTDIQKATSMTNQFFLCELIQKALADYHGHSDKYALKAVYENKLDTLYIHCLHQEDPLKIIETNSQYTGQISKFLNTFISANFGYLHTGHIVRSVSSKSNICAKIVKVPYDDTSNNDNT